MSSQDTAQLSQQKTWPDPSAVTAITWAPETPKPKFSPATANIIIRDTRGRLMGNWKGLQRMIRAHGDLIHRRWVKKKPTQRETLFREIYPDMPTEHRPDCQFYFKELLLTGTMTPGAPRTRMKDFRATCRGAWLWPYLNLDIKGTPREFLLLLDSRVYHHPAQFSVSDLRACDVGSLLDVFSWYYIGGDIVMTDPAVADSYGETRPHNAKRTSVMEFSMEEVSAFKSTREEFQTRAFGQPTTTGVLLLQIQEQLYGFLWTCCRAILHDIQYDELLSMPQEIKSHALLEFGCTQNTSAMVMARESPYQPAMEVNYKRIVALLAGRLDASHDHLQALREDPAYFLEQQRIWKEIQSRTRESMMPEEPPIEFTDSWASIQVTHHALGKAEVWAEILSQVTELELHFRHNPHTERFQWGMSGPPVDALAMTILTICHKSLCLISPNW